MSILTRRMTMARTGRTWLNLVTPDSGETVVFRATATDDDGNVYAAGWVTTATTTGRAACLAKFGPTGILLWSRTLDTANSDEWYDLAIDSGGNVIAAGRALNSAMVAKYSPDGTLVWSKTFKGTGTTAANGVAVDSGDNIVLVGYDQAPPIRATVSKYNNSGTLVWHRVLTGADSGEFYGVAVDALDDIIIAGNTGSPPATNIAGALVAKYNSAGVFQWDKLLNGASGNDLFLYTALGPSGEIYTVGFTSSLGAGNADVLIAAYNSTGVLQWQRVLGGTSVENGLSIVVNDVGDLIVAGRTASDGAGSLDLLLVKYSPTGTLEWQRTFGAADGDVEVFAGNIRISLTPTGDIAVAGTRDAAVGTANLGSFIAVFPGNGSGTGTMAGYTYAASTLTDAVGTLTDSAISLTSSAPTFIESTSGMTDAPAALDVDFYQIIA